MDMNTLLESLYAKDAAVSSLEKTAEATMFDNLRSNEQVEENPFMSLSTDELIKLAQDLDVTEEEVNEAVKEAAETEEGSEELEKIAFDMLGGQIMAHSMVHEFGLMKEAMAEGVCRVCKTNSWDVEGSSICTECLEGE
jgi:hypothetical protein